MDSYILEKQNEFEVVSLNKSTKNFVYAQLFFETKNISSKASLCFKECDLPIDKTFFADNLKNTKQNQKQCNKQVCLAYKQFKKIYAYCKKHNIELDRKIYIENLDKHHVYYAKIFEIVINAKFVYKNKQRLIYVYDKVCDVIDLAYNTLKPCGFENGTCVNPTTNPHNPNACCNIGCKYLSKDGCKTKNICCKIFYCHHRRKQGYYLNANLILPLKMFWNACMRNIVGYNFYRSRELVLTKLNYARFLFFLVV